MQVGDLVRIKSTNHSLYNDPKYVGKLAIVVIKGTWSVDIHIIGSNNSWRPRICIGDLEVISEGR